MKPHPNVLQLFGVLPVPLGILTEYLGRGSLDKILYSSEPIDLRRVVLISKDIACGMMHLHMEVRGVKQRNENYEGISISFTQSLPTDNSIDVPRA